MKLYKIKFKRICSPKYKKKVHFSHLLIFNSFLKLGDREVKSGATTETKTFNRELTVPDYVDLEKMNAFLLNKDAKNFLVLEAPILMEKYQYRRSAFDKSNPASHSQSPSRAKSAFLSSPMHSPSYQQHQPRSTLPGKNAAY